MRVNNDNMPAKGPASANRGGIFVTFEGDDGAGKSTQIRALAKVLESLGHEVVCVREPGGTIVGEKLRKIVLDPSTPELTPECELLVYEAARAQVVDQVIRPALDAGKVVLCDRFTDSTIAYQSAGRGLDRRFVEAANSFATKGLVPDATIILKLRSPKVKAERMADRLGRDRIEQAGREFGERVNQAFLDLSEEDPSRMHLIYVKDAKQDTAREIASSLEHLFPNITEHGQDMSVIFEGISAQRDKERVSEQVQYV